jgi:hypothetical protein
LSLGFIYQHFIAVIELSLFIEEDLLIFKMLKDLVGAQKANEIVVELEDLIENIQTLGWKEIRPWNEFFAVFKVPQWTQKHLEERLTTNFLHYRSNYFVICLVLFVLQIVLSPVIIFSALLIAMLYVGLFTLLKNNVRFGDFIVSLKMKQYFFCGVTFLVLIFSGALARIAWFLLSCGFVVGGHMLFRPRNMTSKANKVYEEMKLNGYDMQTIFQMPSLSSPSSGASSGGAFSSSDRYNGDKPAYTVPLSKSSDSYEKKKNDDLEDPVEEVDASNVSAAGYTTNLSDSYNQNQNMRKRNAPEYDYKHK